VYNSDLLAYVTVIGTVVSDISKEEIPDKFFWNLSTLKMQAL
jgi:hypothetical protein